MKRTIVFNCVLISLACLAVVVLLFAGRAANAQATAAGAKSRIDTPLIFPASSTQTSINVTVCATNSGTNATGLPAGFSLQWMSGAPEDQKNTTVLSLPSFRKAGK